MSVMIDPAHIWNVIYNARSNRHHPHTSPNTAPATQNECHEWSCSQMKFHLQCAEQPASPSHLTKYCACHPKWMSWVIVVTDEMWFTMRRARGISLTPHQMLHLPRRLTVMIHRARIWNVIYHARSNRHHPHTSPNTAPATQKERHDWSCYETSFKMRGATGITLTPHQILTCHAKRASWLIVLTYETAFTVRGATGITLTPHQILRLPGKMTVMMHRAHIWSVIYNRRSDRHQPPTSPNTAPATPNCTPKS